jgi:hypothetical protein
MKTLFSLAILIFTAGCTTSPTATIDYKKDGKEEIRKVLQENQGAYSMCYQQAAYDNPKLEMKMAFSFVIQPAGYVSDVKLLEVTGGKKTDPLVACMTKTLWSLEFPKSAAKDEIEIEKYPFAFSPEGLNVKK